MNDLVPINIAAWLACLTFVVMLVNGGTKMVRNFKGEPSIPPNPQPFVVEITKQLHEQFASKEVFDKHTAHNTARHSQLFDRLDQVERIARAEMQREILAVQTQRAHSMEKLNDQFTFIRESIAAINTELKLKRETE